MLARFRQAISSTTPAIPSTRADSAANWPSVVGLLVDMINRGSGAARSVQSSLVAG